MFGMYENFCNVKNSVTLCYEVSKILGAVALTKMQQTMAYTSSVSEDIVELQRDLGVLKERCRLQEMINSLNDEFIQLIELGNSKQNPKTQLIEVEIQQYKEALDNLILSDCRDCSSSDVNDLQGSLDSQLKHLTELLEIANDQSQFYLNWVDNSEKLIHKNHLTIGLFKPEVLVNAISDEVVEQTRKNRA